MYGNQIPTLKMKLDLNKKIIDHLKSHAEQRFTARELAKWAFEQYPEECRQKGVRSKNKLIANAANTNEKDQAVINAIVAELSGERRRTIQKQNPKIKTTEERPRKYYYTEKTDQMEAEAAEAEGSTISSVSKVYESDLYAILSEFLWAEYGIYSKRIDEKRSSNTRGTNGNKWLYPDLVGMEDLTSDWDQATKNCVQQYADKKAKLWSFEVKLLINRSNVREYFFQAVSNSSWANYGYLVAATLEGADTKQELQILSALHGIGFILLDTDTPAESQVLIPAKERTAIDWDTANRIIEENRDFKDFIEEVTSFHQTGKTKTSDWDIVED
jgi:hypothetical protein